MHARILESPFKFLHCSLILRHEHKWNTFLARLTKPIAEAQEQTSEMVKDHSLPKKVERPMGRDKAKKLHSSNNASSSTACLERCSKRCRMIIKIMSNRLRRQQMLLSML
jgi:ABC-type protease/lipase transport system fused ATPase/permease subunit